MIKDHQPGVLGVRSFDGGTSLSHTSKFFDGAKSAGKGKRIVLLPGIR